MRISVKGAKKILATAVGAAQSALGISAVIIASIVYKDFFGLRALLNVSTELIPLYTFFLAVFGFFSVISGLFLLTEREEAP